MFGLFDQLFWEKVYFLKLNSIQNSELSISVGRGKKRVLLYPLFYLVLGVKSPIFGEQGGNTTRRVRDLHTACRHLIGNGLIQSVKRDPYSMSSPVRE